jgi:hypothetical protein
MMEGEEGTAAEQHRGPGGFLAEGSGQNSRQAEHIISKNELIDPRNVW